MFVQVNTSGEESKSGVEPGEVVPLVQHVLSCKHLQFAGLMTIGMPDYSSRPENFEVGGRERFHFRVVNNLPRSVCSGAGSRCMSS